ncbi:MULTISPECIES: DUF1467 family protein [Pseudovibrio]|uniref:DUF1467 family protein n=1 Tax=Stappiaceae TaxID=2821832 RepID=UPI0023662867|nr:MULTISPECIES: DUF1467 family protein [Pseudovibrio]MDD7908523.1 DUF1467 family protein [Pseudovibrio exalbescens]MDX5592722.1 DUF1467 family protein [Pseudovibrio sp. SPO723]
MSLALGLAIYFMMWWILFLAILPFGVRTADELGEDVVPGSAESAPAHPLMLRKVIANTIVTTALFVAVYYVLESGMGTQILDFAGRYMN